MTQTTNNVLMIRPVRFTYNTQTAESNSFQNEALREDAENTQKKALQEFDTMVESLRKEGINVHVIEDTPEPHTPDSIFPNNWISFHQTNDIILYPMQAENRRLERRNDIVESLREIYQVNQIIDFSHYEKENKFLEGTGSLILDRVNKVAYSCLSPRANQDLLKEFGEKMQYEMIVFDALDRHKKPIYHTNVVMCMGNNFGVICLECVPDTTQKQNIINAFERTNKELIEISFEQLENFAGNMLQLKTNQNSTILVMSERAFKSLTNTQIEKITKYTKIFHSPLDTIENNGGGSARCMIAEVFLAKK
ncbi:MAG: amidinotransferase [Bacteroidetes bacterium]|nr:MAG: amidinotransferase [Bacteroidota bacterium]